METTNIFATVAATWVAPADGVLEAGAEAVLSVSPTAAALTEDFRIYHHQAEGGSNGGYEAFYLFSSNGEAATQGSSVVFAVPDGVSPSSGVLEIGPGPDGYGPCTAEILLCDGAARCQVQRIACWDQANCTLRDAVGSGFDSIELETSIRASSAR